MDDNDLLLPAKQYLYSNYNVMIREFNKNN